MPVHLSLCSTSPHLASSESGEMWNMSPFHGSLLEPCVHVQTAGDPVTAPHVCSSGSLLNSETFRNLADAMNFLYSLRTKKISLENGDLGFTQEVAIAAAAQTSKKEIVILDEKRAVPLKTRTGCWINMKIYFFLHFLFCEMLPELNFTVFDCRYEVV